MKWKGFIIGNGIALGLMTYLIMDIRIPLLFVLLALPFIPMIAIFLALYIDRKIIMKNGIVIRNPNYVKEKRR